MKIEEGVMIVKDGKGWGYKEAGFETQDWVDLEDAEIIEQPKYRRTLEEYDKWEKDHYEAVEPLSGKMVRVKRVTSLEIGDEVDLPTKPKLIQIPEVTAKIIAHHFHKGQKYGDVDYIVHVGDVVNRATNLYGDTPHIADVAWLHDVVEDCDGCTLDTLRGYGVSEVVVKAVDLLTKKDGISYEDYIAELVNEGGLALKVKVADTMCNIKSSMTSKESGRINKYTKQLELLNSGLSINDKVFFGVSGGSYE
jgi:hypothetical protein